MDLKYNALGFNKQTEVLLRGVGGEDLVKEFKRRDISTDHLHKLTKKDFIQLGADEDLAEKMFLTLYISKEKTSDVKLKPHQKISNKVKILTVGRRQLDEAQALITFCIMKLKKKRYNSFIEPDEGLSASKVLHFAADSLLKEINETELNLKELEAAIMPTSRKYFYALYWIPASGFCIATYILFNRFWK